LYGKKIFTSLDLKDGFYQIDLDPDSTKYFAFSTPYGQFEFVKLPFGYSEAPAEFQKRVFQIFDKLTREEKILVYIDDIITTETVEQNLEILREVLTVLKQYRLELRLSKCNFFKKRNRNDAFS
jgi:hypothetical protein